LLPRNDLRSVVTIFALLRAGCAIFFINPTEPPKRLAELLGALPIDAVLAPSPEVAAQQPAARGVPDPELLGDPSASVAIDAPLAGDARALLFGTSGSTATSKIVAQAHYNAAINAEALRLHHALGPGVRVLGCLPIHHVNGLHFTLLATLWAGAQAILLETFKPAQYLRALAEHRPAIASVVPSILEALLLARRGASLPPELRYFVSAAAPLSARTCAAVLDELGVRVLQGYGLTETTNFSTTMPDGLSDAAYRRLMIDAAIPSIGVALHGNEVAVLRPDGSRAPAGEIGEICMRGHNVMLGYVDNEEATREAFMHGWFHSQDLGFEILDEEPGRSFFVVTGRRKNMAKVMGIAVSLEEMERTLLRLPSVLDAACFSVPDRLLGESLVAVVVSAQPLDSARIGAHLRDYFGPVVLPRRYVQAEAIPRTATGKILRTRLGAMFADVLEPATRREDPAP
jgi:acyl-CoA synthetase (AMP-forming)/AMP-acid ligase II